MYLVQLLLPLRHNDGRPFPEAEFSRVGHELTERFGGLTAFTRAPAEGVWKDSRAETNRDDIIVFEVMTETLDRHWWGKFRAVLEKRFAQEELIIRAQPIEQL